MPQLRRTIFFCPEKNGTSFQAGMSGQPAAIIDLRRDMVPLFDLAQHQCRGNALPVRPSRIWLT